MRTTLLWLVLALVSCGGMAYGKEDRWSSFAEDSDLTYYLDKKSVVPLPEGGYLFWLKSVPKDRDFSRREFNLTTLSYILTNYELDCPAATYRVRGTALFDKNRKELSKNVAGADAPFEPIQPESVVEMAQESLCPKAESAKARVPETPQQQPGGGPVAASEPSVQ